jgi:hypothetical protein
MDHVTALAEAFEVAHPVIAGVMIEVGSGQDYTGLPLLHSLHEIGPTSSAAAAGAPDMRRRVEPPPVGQAANFDTVRSTAGLANAGGALEPHASADLRPIAGIIPAHLRPDRHRDPVSFGRSTVRFRKHYETTALPLIPCRPRLIDVVCRGGSPRRSRSASACRGRAAWRRSKLFSSQSGGGAAVRIKSCTLMMTTAGAPRRLTMKRSLFFMGSAHDLSKIVR